MRIGILMPGGYAVVPAVDGRKSQIQYQADALERIGHQVVRLNPWESYDLAQLDALHIVEGGIGNTVGFSGRPAGVRRVGLATFIDSFQPGWKHAMFRRAGRIHPRLLTQQGIFWRQARACDLVIARSRDEQRLLIEGVGADPAKVKIVLNGVNPPGPVDVESVRREFGIEGDFALHISFFTQRRKNVLKLIEAIGPLKIPLVIGGSQGSQSEAAAVFDAAKKWGNVKFVGRLSVMQRDSLYAACRVFCLPSTYEGTGLVALEAASHGAAVVITQVGGPPDYFADLADYADPTSVESIRVAVQRAWDKPRDGRLQKHVIENLSWDASARSLAEAYA